MTLPTDITNAETLQQAAARLGAFLGLEGAAPEPATQRAVNDPPFARALIGARNNQALLIQIMAAADTMRIAPQHGTETKPDQPPSNAALLAKAAGSALKWGMKGLEHAEPWVVERRLAACAACEYQAPAPKKLVYLGAQVVVGKDAKICTQCHCLTNTKAALATEACPEADPDQPDMSRWGEAIGPRDPQEGSIWHHKQL